MEQLELLQRQNKALKHLSALPRKMLLLHGMDNVTEFVLHDLCDAQCFNLTKAAYFVDNPDFNCTKGVAGFSREESFAGADALWQDPKTFSAHMALSPFNQRVRSLNRCSIQKGAESREDLATMLAKDLGFANHGYCSWNMRYDNHGFMLYEKADIAEPIADEQLLDGMCLLSFCPIF